MGLERTQRRKYLSVVLLAFIISRVLFYWAGIRFDDSSLPWHWQFIDPYLLKTSLLESLYYLHSQPPFFNFILGLILKLFPHHATLAFTFSYWIFGLALGYSLFWIMTRLGVSDWLSMLLTILFIINPALILFENYLFYTYLEALLLCLAAFFWMRFLKKGTFLNGFFCFLFLSFLVLTHSLFHFLWFLVFPAILLFSQSGQRKKIIWVGLFPFLLALSLYAKNGILFGQFAGGSWLGMNFSRITTFKIPVEERQRMVDQGEISSLALIHPFSPVTAYRDSISPCPTTGIPVLDQEKKSTGFINYNHIAYIEISKKYLQDALFVFRFHPEAFFRGLSHSFFYYFLPSGDPLFFTDNWAHIRNYDRVFNLLVYGRLLTDDRIRLREEGLVRKLFNTGIFMVLGYSFLIFYGLFLIIKGLKGKPKDWSFLLTILFIWLNILYVTLIGNAFEVGENNRFRFLIDPFFIILLGVFLTYRFKVSNESYGLK